MFLLLFKWNVDTLFAFRFVSLCKRILEERDSRNRLTKCTNQFQLVLRLTFCSASLKVTKYVTERFSIQSF